MTICMVSNLVKRLPKSLRHSNFRVWHACRCAVRHECGTRPKSFNAAFTELKGKKVRTNQKCIDFISMYISTIYIVYVGSFY